MRKHVGFGVLLFVLLWLLPATRAEGSKHDWQVFLQRDTNGANELIFVNVLTGDKAQVSASGQRYTLVGQSVMYYDPATRRVMEVFPGGKPQPHPFIQPGPNTRRVDWRVSDDGTLLAWTLTSATLSNSLTTITTVANVDGTNPHQVLADGPRDGIRALPVAFNADHSVLYMDYQPDGVSELTVFPQYAGLFALELATGTVQSLPGEPGCFCGAGIGGGLFLRLALTSDLSGFDLKVYLLTGQLVQTIPALKLRNYTQAGDILISPDGTRAVYALAQIKDFGTPKQSVETVFMLVDLQQMTQTPLTDPITTYIHPVAWTDNNSAILFTSPQRDGTWKISLSSGKLVKIADATYLGVLQY